jgi:TonB family protein
MTAPELLIKATIVMSAAFLAVRVLRRSPAAWRHFVWTAAFAVLLALPAAEVVTPKWGLEAPPQPPAARAARAAIAAVPPAAPLPRTAPRPAREIDWPLLVWALGCAITASRFLAGFLRTRWIVRHASDAPYAHAAGAVPVLESADVAVPMAWGVLHPVVILPPEARGWPAPRLRSALLHEISHIERRDLAAQWAAQAACAVYWFHPLAWTAARQLRKERERACDDAVLVRGVAPHEYAGHLLEMARALATRRVAPADAPAMADAPELESRVRALLDPRRDRRPLARRTALAVAACVALALVPIAGVTLRAQGGRGTLAGVVEDASGGRVPNCEVVAKNLDGPNEEITRVDMAGEYLFAAIPPGRYGLEFRSPGFKAQKAEVVVAAGQAARFDAKLDIGGVSERLVVKGGAAPQGIKRPRPAAAIPQNAGAPVRIRVGGNVQASKLIYHVNPVYPPALLREGVSGTVLLHAVISVDGSLLHVEAINTNVNPGLAAAALDAVRQWRYQPTLLNGQPVEVTTTITVDFQL